MTDGRGPGEPDERPDGGPGGADRRDAARHHERAADRCDELADVAELMGDDATAGELRAEAHRNRLSALRLLDG